MPLFYFDIHGVEGRVPDEEGMVLLNLDAAQVEAVRSLADVFEAGQIPHAISIEVFDEHHLPVFNTELFVDRKH